MNIDEYLARKKELETLLKKEGKSAIMDFFGTFMEKNPEIKAIRWMQYTPYFNDGDACVFGLGDPYYLTRVPTSEELENNPDGEWEPDDESGWLTSYHKSMKKMAAFEKKFSELEDMFESVFGDHKDICVYKTEKGTIKVQVMDFEHD